MWRMRGVGAAAGASLLALGAAGAQHPADLKAESKSKGASFEAVSLDEAAFDLRNLASFHHDHILGTSLDLWVIAGETDAVAAEEAVLDEIERLRLVFSTYEPLSEISRLNRSSGPVSVSLDMIAVLRGYDFWQHHSGGALHGQSGALIQLWRDAEKTGREPDAVQLETIVQELRQSGWEIDEASQTVTRRTNQPLDLNAIAKGYILQRAAATVRVRTPQVRGLLLNLGGDLAAWGESLTDQHGWTIDVQDPVHPQENAAPVARIRIAEGAVATSGGYQRYYTVAGQRFSHLLDPRTGRPARGVASATVVAADNVTANAMATTLCVLSPEEGLRLVQATSGVSCLLIMPDGRQLRSAGLEVVEEAAPESDEKPSAVALKGDPWPEGYQVSVAIELPKIANERRYRRPYVAVWVEDADGKPVRSLTVWGNSPKYLKDLTDWWKFARDNRELIRAVTRATRAPGKYEVAWDGKDDKGNPVSRGTYTVRVEVHREHGKHLRQSGKIVCDAEPAKTTLDKNEETEATRIEFGKKK